MTGAFAPKRPFGTFRCCAWLILRFRTAPPSVRRCSARLIRQAETLELQPHSRPPSSHTVAFAPKRSTSRFALLTLRNSSVGVGRAAALLTRMGARGRAKPFPRLHSPGGRSNQLHPPRPGKPSPKRCREARRLPDFIPQRRRVRREERFFHSQIPFGGGKIVSFIPRPVSVRTRVEG